jgi:large subunit ribosomal protein L13
MDTFVTKPAEVERKWFVVDATDKVLGRLAAEVASILRGKKKPIYQPHVDTGDYVVIVNADKIRLTGLKTEKKEYYVPQKYIGHSFMMDYKDLFAKYPERVVERAVRGMLPHNPLGRKMGKKLFVYAGGSHRHQAQKPETLELS